MKAIEQHFHVVLFIMLYKVVLKFEFRYTRRGTRLKEQHTIPETNLHHNYVFVSELQNLSYY